MSDTPRTDAATFHRGGLLVVQQDLARTLERELAAAKADSDSMRQSLREAADTSAKLVAEVEALRAALEYAVRQNEHDIILTGDECRAARAALAKEKS
jgi:septal ring factor EnvC (AmiA/AmiB activator)